VILTLDTFIIEDKARDGENNVGFMIKSHPTLLDDYLISWKKAFLTDVTSFDRSQLRPFLGIRVGIMVIIPLVIGLLTNPTPVYILVSLGVFYVSIPEGFPTKWSRMRVLSLTCVINPVVFSIATLIGTIGAAGVLPFGLGFFLLSYMRVVRNIIPIIFVAAIALAVGVGYPGGSVPAALERFWFFLVGGLFGLLGAFVSQFHSKKSAYQNKTKSEDHHSSLKEKLRPLRNDLSVKSTHFRSSIAVGIAGAAGLAIAQYLDISRDYWVVMTIALLLLRDNASITLSYITSRIVGSILAALIGYEIVATVYNQWISVVLVFLFVAAYFATRGMSYLLSTFFITLFVLSLVALSMPPGATSVAQIRVVDTLIGAAISLLTVSIIIARHKSLSTTVWQV